jgi:hypothetical protein
MNDDNTLFPSDQNWLEGSYDDLKTLFGSWEYFAQYIKKRFPNVEDSDIENLRSTFLIEDVDVIFVSDEKIKRTIVRVAYASSTLIVQIPDNGKLNNDQKEEIRQKYLESFFPRIKESHARMNTLLWKLLSDKERLKISKTFPLDKEIIPHITRSK